MDPWFWLNELPELYRVLALFAFEHISDSVRMAGREKHRRSILRPIFRFFRNHSRKTEGPILTRRPKGMIVTYMTWLKHKIRFHKNGFYDNMSPKIVETVTYQRLYL